MFKTLLGCIGLAVLAYWTAGWVTKDFSVWTAEGARRADVLQTPVAVPAVRLEGPGIVNQPASELLADGRSVTILDFVYTRCVSICTTLGSGFQQLQASIKAEELQRQPVIDLAGQVVAGGGAAPRPGAHARGRVRLLSVSFDGKYDDVAELRRYAAQMRADPGIWRFAGVPDAGERRALLDAFGVVVIPDGMGGYQHNAALLLVDARGRLVRMFDYGELTAALAQARALAAGGRG
jgi:protein SCO1/2